MVRELRSDLYTYEYHCADIGLEYVRQSIDFFHNTTKVIYYNNYIENMLLQSGRGIQPQHLELLGTITDRFKYAEYDFVDILSQRIMDDGLTAHDLKSIVQDELLKFCANRKQIFCETAKDYKILLDGGLHAYRRDLETFIANHETVTEFDFSILRDECVIV